MMVWTVLWCAALMLCVAMSPRRARADVTSDQGAAILVFPKILVDVTKPEITPPVQIDTLIRVSNTSNREITMQCFYVNATPHCSNTSGSCLPRAATPCVGTCQAQWVETDFIVHITARQPIAWLASLGATLCENSDDPSLPCLPLDDEHPGQNGQSNTGSGIPGVSEDPFIGELKCIAVDENLVPVERNDLKGEAEIVRTSKTSIDVEAYNAIGIPAIPGTNNGDSILVLGGGVCLGGSNPGTSCDEASKCVGGHCSAEYSGCPNILILDHFFDGAEDPVAAPAPRRITTHLTLVPCSEDFLTQVPITTPVQFLVFNEFEQRFSTSRRITCFEELKISNIETRSPDRSIFSAAVAGTLTGQTRIRGVADDDKKHGHTLLGVAEEFRDGGGTAAVNLHFQGGRPQSDFIYLP